MKDILPASGTWVGPPLLQLKLISLPLMTLDGRKRQAEHEARRLKSAIPTQVVTSHLEACKALIHNGHQDRAAQHAMTYAPELIERSTAYLSTIFDVSRQKLLPYLHALRSPSEQHKLPRRAMSVVKSLETLRERVIERGTPATLSEIEECMGEFLK